MTLRIGTRRSALALVQARQIADALDAECELVEIVTSGDRGGGPDDKSRWVDELEAALVDEHVDLAVHSAKDVPGELAGGLEIAAVPLRADARDALCGAESLEALSSGARVGTSSLRRRAQLLAVREDLEVIDLRGNVDTRLRKLAGGECDALVLALAGLQRLGRQEEAQAVLDDFVPAPGQGALALEARTGDAVVSDALAAIDDADAHACLRAERSLGRALGASCNTPIGARARSLDRGLELCVFIGLPDGSEWITDRLEGDNPETLGRAASDRLAAAGGHELLERSEKWSR